MQMKDIDENEWKQIETGSVNQVPISTNKDIDDAELIARFKKLKENEFKMEDELQQSPKLIEPTLPIQQKYSNIIDVPKESSDINYWKIVGLPSKGKFYPTGVDIVGRPMKVLEVKKISSMTEENGDFILNDILKKTTRGIAVEDIYVADKIFIIFWLRANTYRESGYVVPYVCPKCEKKSDYHFGVDNLEVQEVSDDFEPNKEYKLIGGQVITYDYLKIKDELYIDKFTELNKAVIKEVDVELLAIAQMVKTINREEKTLLQKYNWVTELTPGDYSHLRSIIEKKGMGVKPYVNATCKECGGSAAIAVSFREDFFLPEVNVD